MSTLGALATGLAACPGPTFQEYGEAARPAMGPTRSSDPLELETVAYGRPELVAVPPDVLAGRPEPMVIVSHTAIRGGWRVILRPEVGQPIRLDYRIAASLRLPVETGERLWWSLPLDERGDFAGLIVRDEDQLLRALVSIDGGLSGLIDLDLRPDFEAGSLVYTEVIANAGCLTSIDHHAFVIREGSRSVRVYPGTSRTIALSAASERARIVLEPDPDEPQATFELVALDASRPTPRRSAAAAGEDDGRCPRPAHVSWVLVRP